MLTLALTVASSIAISRPAVAIYIVGAGRTAEVTSNGREGSMAATIGDPALSQAAPFATGWPWRSPD
jgi:hypothetical protein